MKAATISLFALVALVMVLVLLFVAVMTDLLIERQSESLAVLRSRGLSRSQILGLFASWELVLCLFVLLLGLIGSGLLVQLLAVRLLPASSPSVLSLLSRDWPSLLPSLGWPALLTALAALGALLTALWHSLRSNIVSLYCQPAPRNDTSRPAPSLAALPPGRHLSAPDARRLQPLLLFYEQQRHRHMYAPDPALAPLPSRISTLTIGRYYTISNIFLPQLLFLASRLAVRRRGATSLLAVAQPARSPHQPVRMTLLLSLATAFAIFSLVFLSTQEQRASDVWIYTVGADISGPLAFPARLDDLTNLTSAYRRLPGVLASSLGCATTASAGGSLQLPIALRAVDRTTFGQVALWPQRQGSEPALSTLMGLLRAGRGRGEAHRLVPAVIDKAAAQSLHLSKGSTLVLTMTAAPGSPPVEISFIVVGQVSAIPTVPSSPQGNVANGVRAGGVLVDYQTCADIFEGPALAAGSDLLPLNYVGLRTSEQGQALLHLRALMTSGDLELTLVYDRHALLEELRYEPLYLDLLGLLTLGISTALLLALIGNLLGSWQSTRGRVLQFALLRALGSSSRQLIAMIAWEQGLVYLVATALGSIFGLVLARLVVPALIFTGTPSTGSGSNLAGAALYVSQRVPAVQLIFPPPLLIPLAGSLLICLLSLVLVVIAVSRLTMERTLRLNED